jgi:hypothetical protein
MRRRDFIRGLGLLGIGLPLADQLAFVQGLGRVFPSAAVTPALPAATHTLITPAGAHFSYDRQLTPDEMRRVEAWVRAAYDIPIAGLWTPFVR